MSVEPGRHYVRNPAASAVTSADGVLFLMPGEEPYHAPDVDATAVARTWELLATPRRGAELEARASADPPGLAGLLETLIARAFVLRGTVEEFRDWQGENHGHRGDRRCRHLVVGVTGAVQAALVPQQLRRLSVEFADRIDVILTSAAKEFVQGRAIAAQGAGVWDDPFEQRGDIAVPHVHLARAAEMLLVLPATADAIFRLAHGAASDLLGLVACATCAPVVVVPSMNAAMWRHAAVQRNVETLRRDGAYVIEPGPGWSIAEEGERGVGGAGLGAGSGNLTGALEAVLEVSRRRSLRPAPLPPASSEGRSAPPSRYPPRPAR